MFKLEPGRIYRHTDGRCVKFVRSELCDGSPLYHYVEEIDGTLTRVSADHFRELGWYSRDDDDLIRPIIKGWVYYDSLEEMYRVQGSTL